MEKSNPVRGILWLLLSGAALAAGGFFLSKAFEGRMSCCSEVKEGDGAAKEDQFAGIYCAVPEGADICYPES